MSDVARDFEQAEQAEEKLNAAEGIAPPEGQAGIFAAQEAEASAGDPEPEEEPSGVDYIEYVGTGPYGVEFEDERSISRKEAKTGWDITIPRDLVWRKGKGARAKRMLLPTADMTPETLAALENEPGFKKVTLDS